jgi:hypothetical protein
MEQSVIMSIAEQTELGLKPIGDITGCFWVPSYQRGYRWSKENVSLLLTDIWENGDKDYCLQPIVVKRQPDDRFELIDGQQRLTTLYLIFLYMKLERLQNFALPFSIEYETRPRSADYLTTLDEAQKDANIDFFHMHDAFRCIKEWFDDHGARRQHVANKFYGYLYDRVKVIWYEAGHDVDSTTLFTRLNVGRIPLTNAELVKALLLARKAPPSSNPEPSLQSDDYRQIEIASQWDMIERDLHDEGFWAFLSNRPGRDFPTRIEFIFNIMATIVGNEDVKDRFHTFFYFKVQLENQSAQKVWSSILELYYFLKEWYEDRDLYHKVGYLVAVGVNLADLVRESKESIKSAFHELLDTRIMEELDLSEEAIEDLSYERPDPCTRLLLLFNVETVRTLKNSSERYPFHAHKEQSWSLEHIHAQHSESLNTKEQWQEWLQQHRTALEMLKLNDREKEANRINLLKEIGESLDDINKESFAQLSIRITEIFNATDSADSMHAISNLALLSGGVNSALSNSVFQVKRLKIIERDRNGDYIPIGTRRVFFKYYTNVGDQQMHLWSRQDRQCYLAAICGMLRPYLKPNTGIEG